MITPPVKNPADTPIDVVVLGPLNVDLMISGAAPQNISELNQWAGASTVQLNSAGAAGYPAQVFRKLGLRTGVISTTADDTFGLVLRNELAGAGIDTTHIRIATEELSSIAVYMLLFGDKKRPLAGRLAKHQPWPAPLSEAERAYAGATRLFHVAGYLHYPEMWDSDIPTLLHQVRHQGTLVSLDPQFPVHPFDGPWFRGIEHLLPCTNVLLLDEIEARNITGETDLLIAGKQLARTGPDVVVIKQGDQGSMFFSGGRNATRSDQVQVFHQPAISVPDAEIADTIGAGDAFDASFLAALISGFDLHEAATFATEIASQSLRGHGAVSALPKDLGTRLLEQ